MDKVRIMPQGHWDWPKAVPLSQGWRIGPWVYVGGQVSQDENGKVLHPFDIKAQTREVFQNIESVLVEAGGGLEDLIKFNTFYVYNGPEEGTDQYWKDMTDVRLEYLRFPGPVGTTVRVAGLALYGLMIEIDATAYIPKFE